MARDDSRASVLARRVGWLDRHRRTLALVVTAVLCPLLLLRGHAALADYVTSEWPRLPSILIALVVGVTVWMITETVLAWLTAVWETDCVRLMREHDIPPARVIRRRK
jgi:hypothetical protein